jgi:hypothetical protein
LVDQLAQGVEHGWQRCAGRDQLEHAAFTVIERGVRVRFDCGLNAHGVYLSLSTAMALSPYTCAASGQ